MKKILIIFLILFSSHLNAQSEFDGKATVTSSDGTSYKVVPLGRSANRVRVSNLSTSLSNEVKKYPDVTNDKFEVMGVGLDWLLTPLNKTFSKEKLLAFSKDSSPIRIFAVSDRDGNLKEVNFYLPKSTALTVNDLRKLELIIKAEHKMQYGRLTARGRGFVWDVGPPSKFQELNGIPYFPFNAVLDMKNAYDAVRSIRTSEEVWILPGSRG